MFGPPELRTAYKLHFASHPACLACGASEALQVHHVIPFQICIRIGRPELEWDVRNLVTLCERRGYRHHLVLGHLGDNHSFNPLISNFAALFRNTRERSIRADPRWKRAAAAKPRSWETMSEGEKESLRELIERTF